MAGFPDQQVIFQPNENISSLDGSNVAYYAWQIHKTFVNSFVSPAACRASGFVPTFLGNSTPSPSIQLSGPGIVLLSLPQPWSVNDPNGYSGTLFYLPAGASAVGITPPGSGIRTDSLDLIYSELNGASTGIGQKDLRDQIESDGTILLNQPFYTRNIASYQISYIQNSQVTPPVAGAVRLMTFTVSSSGECVQTFLLPSIWENQVWPSGSPNTVEQSQSLIDNLSSIRYQLNAIIGESNWYSAAPTSLVTLLSNIIALQGEVKGENIVRNAGMLITQRGNSGNLGPGAGYTLDGYIVGSSGGSVNWGVSYQGGTNCLQLSPTVALTNLTVQQNIESVAAQTLGYTNVTFQATIYNNGSPTLTPSLTIAVPTAIDNFSSQTTVLSTSLQSIPMGQTVTVAYTFATSNSYSFQNGISFLLQFGSGVSASENVFISNIDMSPTPYAQVGLNSNPPVPQIRSYSEQLLECQRFYQTIGGLSGPTISFGFGGITDNSSEALIFINFLCKMKVTPTCSVVGISDFVVTDSFSNTEVLDSLTATDKLGSYSVVLNAITAGSPWSPHSWAYMSSQGGGGTLIFSCEL